PAVAERCEEAVPGPTVADVPDGRRGPDAGSGARLRPLRARADSLRDHAIQGGGRAPLPRPRHAAARPRVPGRRLLDRRHHDLALGPHPLLGRRADRRHAAPHALEGGDPRAAGRRPRHPGAGPGAGRSRRGEEVAREVPLGGTVNARRFALALAGSLLLAPAAHAVPPDQPRDEPAPLGWAQQYDDAGRPAGMRPFEPAALASWKSRYAIDALDALARATGERPDGVPRSAPRRAGCGSRPSRRDAGRGSTASRTGSRCTSTPAARTGRDPCRRPARVRLARRLRNRRAAPAPGARCVGG